MLLRNIVWRVHQRVGDGGALTAVLAQALTGSYNALCERWSKPVLLARGVRRAVQAVVEGLSELSQPPQGEDDLVQWLTPLLARSSLAKFRRDV